MGSLCSAQKAEDRGPSPTLLYLGSESLPSEELALGTELSQPGEWDDAGQTKPPFLPFHVVILKVFVPLCC